MMNYVSELPKHIHLWWRISSFIRSGCIYYFKT